MANKKMPNTYSPAIQKIKTFAAIRETHKAGIDEALTKKLNHEYVRSPGHIIRIQRTDEEQVNYMRELMEESETLSIASNGLNANENQQKRASKPRQVKNEVGETLDDVIQTLAVNLINEKPSEIWPHLKTEIVEWSSGDCREVKSGKKNMDSWSYHFTNHDDSKDAITFQSFRKKLSKIRSGK